MNAIVSIMPYVTIIVLATLNVRLLWIIRKWEGLNKLQTDLLEKQNSVIKYTKMIIDNRDVIIQQLREFIYDNNGVNIELGEENRTLN